MLGIGIGVGMRRLAKPELITNGTFDSDVSGWTLHGDAGAAVSWQAGRARVDATGGSRARIWQAWTAEIGLEYRLLVTVHQGTAANMVNAQIKMGTTATGSQNFQENGTLDGDTPEVIDRTFTATATTHYVTLQAESAGAYMEFDNVSVKRA